MQSGSGDTISTPVISLTTPSYSTSNPLSTPVMPINTPMSHAGPPFHPAAYPVDQFPIDTGDGNTLKGIVSSPYLTLQHNQHLFAQQQLTMQSMLQG